MADGLAEMKLFSYISSIENAMMCRLKFKKFVQKLISINKHNLFHFRDYNYVLFVLTFLNSVN